MKCYSFSFGERESFSIVLEQRVKATTREQHEIVKDFCWSYLVSLHFMSNWLMELLLTKLFHKLHWCTYPSCLMKLEALLIKKASIKVLIGSLKAFLSKVSLHSKLAISPLCINFTKDIFESQYFIEPFINHAWTRRRVRERFIKSISFYWMPQQIGFLRYDDGWYVPSWISEWEKEIINHSLDYDFKEPISASDFSQEII